MAILDSSVLFGGINEADANHQRCREVLRRPNLYFVIPVLVVAECSFLIARDLGAQAEARFLDSMASRNLELPTPDDFRRMAELVRRYADFPLGGTDASIIALAERLKTDTIISLDRRHFGSVKPAHCEAFRILPE